MSNTNNYNLYKPLKGDIDWAGKLNENMDNIDEVLKSHDTSLSDIPNINEINYFKKILSNKLTVNSQSSDYYLLKDLALQLINLSSKTTTNGVKIYTPDATGQYNSFWVRDFAYMLNGCLDYFTPQNIEDCFRFIADKIDTNNWWVADHIGTDGTVFWTPGNTNDWGTRAILDGNFFIIDILYSHYKLSQDISLYSEYKNKMKSVLESGIPYDDITGLVSLPIDSNIATYGFWDTVRMSGKLFMMSVMSYQSYTQMAVMAYENGDITDSIYYTKKAKKIKKNLNDFHFIGSFVTNRGYLSGYQGFYSASDGKCKDQSDIWGSALAVWLDIPDKDKQIAIAKSLIFNHDYMPNNIFYKGGVRHVPKSGDFIADTQVWESYMFPQEYGKYQNGGYWATPIPWVCYAISLVDKGKAEDIMLECLQNNIFADTNSSYEWISTNGNKGVLKYVCNATLPILSLQVGEQRSSAYIIEQGISNNINYRKYSNGYIEYWGSLPDKSILANSDYDGYITYPFPLVEIPSVSTSAMPSETWQGIYVGGGVFPANPLTQATVHIGNGATTQTFKFITYRVLGKYL